MSFVADMEIKYLVYIPAVNIETTVPAYELGDYADGINWKYVVDK